VLDSLCNGFSYVGGGFHVSGVSLYNGYEELAYFLKSLYCYNGFPSIIDSRVTMFHKGLTLVSSFGDTLGYLCDATLGTLMLFGGTHLDILAYLCHKLGGSMLPFTGVISLTLSYLCDTPLHTLTTFLLSIHGPLHTEAVWRKHRPAFCRPKKRALGQAQAQAEFARSATSN